MSGCVTVEQDTELIVITPHKEEVDVTPKTSNVWVTEECGGTTVVPKGSPVTVRSSPNVTVVEERREKVVISDAGTQGIQGQTGDAGADGDKHFQYDQNTPSDVWIIGHTLNKYPSVSIVDSAGSSVEGCVTYTNAMEVVVRFSSAFAGTAFLN